MPTLSSHHPLTLFADLLLDQENHALQTLNKRYHLNVNMLIFCYWVALAQQGTFSKMYMKKILSATFEWHEKIVLPAQAMCKQIERGIAQEIWTSEVSGYEEAQTFVKMANQAELQIMLDIFAEKPKRNRYTVTQMLMHACLNVLTYCCTICVVLDVSDYVHLEALAKRAFPDADPLRILFQIQSVFAQKQNEGVQQNFSFTK